MAVAATLRAVLGVDTGDFDRGMSKASKKADDFGDHVAGVAKFAAGAMTAAFGASIVAVTAGLDKAIERFDKIATASAKLNVPAERLSALGYAAGQSNTSLETLETGLQKLSQRMTQAAGGNKEAAEQFAALGVSVTDASGRLRASDEVLLDIAESFTKWRAGAADSAIAAALFGKSAGPEMVAFLRQGRAGIGELTEEAERLGAVLSGDAAEAADRFNDNLAKLQTLLQGAFNALAERLLPILDRLSATAVDSAGSVDDLTDELDDLTEAFQLALAAAVTLTNAMQSLWDLLKAISESIGAVTETFGAMGDSLGNTAEYLKQIASGDFAGAFGTIADGLEDIGRAAAGGGGEAKSAWSGFFDGLQKNIADTAGWFERIWGGTEVAGQMQGADRAARSFIEGVLQGEAPVRAFGNATAKTGDAADGAAKRMRSLERAAKDFITGVIGNGQNRYTDFRRNLDAIAERLERMNLTPLQQDARDLGMLLQEAFGTGTQQDIDKIVNMITDFAAAESAAAKEAKHLADGFLSVEEISERAALAVKHNWTDTLTGLGEEITRFIGSGGEGGLGGLFSGLADTLSGGLGTQLNGAISSGFQARASAIERNQDGTAAFSQAFGKGGGFEALGQLAAQQLGAIVGGSGSGAQAGAAIGQAIGYAYFGAVGGAVGALLGGFVGGLFDDDASPRLTVGGRGFAGQEGTARSPFGTIATRTQDINTPGQEIADAIATFDRTVAELLSPEQVQGAARALTDFFNVYKNASASLETVLSERFNVILSTLGSRVGSFVGSTGTLEERVTRLQEAMAVLGRATDGLFRNLLGSNVENAAGVLRDAGDDAAEALDRIGMAAGTTRQQLEDAFNNGEGMTIEQIKLWIEAADSLNELNTAQEAYNAAIEKQRAAVQDYNDFINGFREEALGLSDFTKAMRGLERAERDAVAQANALARAAGLAGAREEDLAQIHEASAIRAARAIRELEDASRSLVEQLYGPMDQVNASASAAAGSLTAAADAIDRARQGLTDFADDLLIGDNSPLAGRDKLAKALELLNDASARGDAQRVQQLADATLGIGRDVFASGRDFNELFDRVQAIIRGTIPAIDDGGALGGAAGDFSASATAISAAERYELASILAQNIADISNFSGDGFDEVAERLGVNLSRLATDLQIGPDTINAFLESLKPPAAADAEILPPGFGQIMEGIDEANDRVVDAIDETAEETVAAVDETTAAVQEGNVIRREGNTMMRRLIQLLEEREARGVRS